MKKFRDEHQQFIAEGDKLVKDLLSCNYHIHEIIGTQKWLQNNQIPYNISITEITEDEFTISNSPDVIKAIKQIEVVLGRLKDKME